MPLYGIIGTFRDFLAHKLTNYQYFSIKPSLFVKYYQSTYSLHVSAQYILNVDFMATKPQKVHKIGHISVCNFDPIDMATFGEYTPSVVTRDSPCWIPGTAPMI